MKWGHAFYTSSSAAACVHLSPCLYPHTLTSPFSPYRFFQLICSLLAPWSDPNHLIGVPNWVTDWPCCSPVSLCNGWLYRQHNGTFINKAPTAPLPPSAPPPSTPSAPTPSCLTVASLTSSFLHVFAISVICYSCLPPLSPPPSPPLTSSRVHPSSPCRGMLKAVEVSNEGGPLGIHVVPFSSQDVR